MTIQQIIENVTTSNGYIYGVKDNLNNSMDGLKIIQNPTDNTYIGVYHTLVGSQFNVKLATSTNLLAWTYIRDIETDTSQPIIIAAPDKSLVIAFEKHTNGGHLKFYHYSNVTNLLNGTINKTYETIRTISNCNEGTPNIYSVTFATNPPDINNSVIDVGFHYQRNKSGGGCDVDRQARGVLTNFGSWSAYIEIDINNAIEPLIHVDRSIGDRDNISYEGKIFTLHEADGGPGTTNFNGWRLFLYDHTSKTAIKLNMNTPYGGNAFANPTLTIIKDPSDPNKQVLVVTLFVPSENGLDPAGTLIYYKIIGGGIGWWNGSTCFGTTCIKNKYITIGGGGILLLLLMRKRK